jgi:hypothetical protein
VSFVSAIAPVARAQSTKPTSPTIVKAEKLFEEGVALLGRKDFANACPKLEESRNLAPGLGVTLYLADCNEGLGRLATALALFREGAALAHTRKDEREAAAQARIAALETSVPRIRVRLAAPAPNLEAQRDGGRRRCPEPLDGPRSVDADLAKARAASNRAARRRWHRRCCDRREPLPRARGEIEAE